MPTLSIATPAGVLTAAEKPSPAPQRGQHLKTVIQSGTSGSNIFTMTGLSTIPAGHLVCVVNTWASTADLVSAGSIVDTSGNTWHSVVGSGQNPGVAICWSVTTNALTPTDTVTLTYSSGTPAARMYAWYDFGTSWGALDTSSTSSAASGAESASVTPASPGDLALFAVGFNGPTDGNAAFYFNSPLVAYTPSHHTGTTSAYFAVADTLLSDTSSFTAKANGDQNQSTWALATFLAAAPANQTINPPVATASASAPAPTLNVNVPPPSATASASAPIPTVTVALAPPAATASASSLVPGLNVNVLPPAATASASAPIPTILSGFVISPPAATASASAPVPTINVNVPPPVATAAASSLLPAISVAVAPASATASASSLVPALRVKVSPASATASASSPIPGVTVAVLAVVATAAASAPLPGQVGNRIQVVLLATLATASASAPIPTVTATGAGSTLITAVLTGYVTVGSTGSPHTGSIAQSTVGDTAQPLTGSTGPVRVGR